MGSKKKELIEKLTQKCKELHINLVNNIKIYEIEFQEVIEECYPNREWWEVTSCQIFNHLLTFKDPEKTIVSIIKQLKEEEVI